MPRKIVVTGIGATTPLGGDAQSTWRALLAGESGISTIEKEWIAQYEVPVTFAGQAKVPSTEVLTPQEAKRLDPSSQFALISAREAWADAGSPQVAPERLAVEFATGIGGVWTLLDAFETLKEKGPRRVLPMTIPMLMPNGPAAAIGMDIAARGGVRTAVSACASSTEAIANAYDRLQTGEIDIVVAGGCEAGIHPLPLAAFSSMHALSKRNEDPQRASRPYDVNRDGFVMGEGGAALVLETEEHALARGAKIYCEISGQGLTSDGYHIAAPDPEGSGVQRAIKFALQNAGMTAKDIVHLNAHATSTPAGDVAEANALRKALGADADHVAVSATKSMTGHLLGGAGAIESVFIVKALQDRLAPPTINIENLDPAVTVDVVRDTPRALPAGDIAALNDSFGFGGHNVVLVFNSI